MYRLGYTCKDAEKKDNKCIGYYKEDSEDPIEKCRKCKNQINQFSVINKMKRLGWKEHHKKEVDKLNKMIEMMGKILSEGGCPKCYEDVLKDDSKCEPTCEGETAFKCWISFIEQEVENE